MPSPQPAFLVHAYHNANALPSEVWKAFDAHPRRSNIMFPLAKKLRQIEQSGYHHDGCNVWIVCTTVQAGGVLSEVDFVLSCTEGPIGAYPIFIFTPISSSRLNSQYYTPRLRAMVRALLECVPPERVFSVFSLDSITPAFAKSWTEETGISLDSSPEYYAATFTHCTAQTLTRNQPVLHGYSHKLRLAVESDIPAAAELCHSFAAVSEPFVLSKEDAIREASLLVRQGQLWVHEVAVPGRSPEIASIVAVTRTSRTVAGITKVYTNPDWRHLGCAERLTRYVCMQLLQQKESVVLYVAHNNPAAANVYHKVGFVGLSHGSPRVEGVDSWLELGFDRKIVDLGHW
ncbi:hypothetical protein WOLCODRAFT_147958 [Wolfiporia cocos MD-104 SS10]|uniref:N-acetyltransferase domain-containing protein n=1 Tax=Wolfiporia cocos (strain MD-104) TaxID=742152 RepID=A0A2H3IWS7_WOLCO|nr:hypothetical protein WOLCODRAFT_147958 [Wolfiporia cocos MD-104 SS10]